MSRNWRSLLFVLCLLGCMSSSLARPLTLGVTDWVGNAPAYIAEAKGYWKQAGLDVKIVKYDTYDTFLADLKTGKIDLAYDMIGTWVDLQQQGVPITILAETDWSNGGDKVIAKNALTDFSQLKGKQVGIYLNKTSVTYMFGKFLASKGLKLSDVKLVEMEGDPLAAAFIKNQFQLVLLYDPPALLAQRNGDGKEVATSAEFPGVMPEGIAAMSSVQKQLGQAQLQTFFEGWLKAVRWMKYEATWPELEKMLRQRVFAGSANQSALDLASMFNSVRFHFGKDLQQRNQAGGGLYNYLGDVKRFLIDNGKLKRELDANALVDNSALLDAGKKVLR